MYLIIVFNVFEQKPTIFLTKIIYLPIIIMFILSVCYMSNLNIHDNENIAEQQHPESSLEDTNAALLDELSIADTIDQESKQKLQENRKSKDYKDR